MGVPAGPNLHYRTSGRRRHKPSEARIIAWAHGHESCLGELVPARRPELLRNWPKSPEIGAGPHDLANLS